MCVDAAAGEAEGVDAGEGIIAEEDVVVDGVAEGIIAEEVEFVV